MKDCYKCENVAKLWKTDGSNWLVGLTLCTLACSLCLDHVARTTLLVPVESQVAALLRQVARDAASTTERLASAVSILKVPVHVSVHEDLGSNLECVGLVGGWLGCWWRQRRWNGWLNVAAAVGFVRLSVCCRTSFLARARIVIGPPPP